MSRAFVFAVAATAGLALLTGCTKDEAPKAAPATTPPTVSAPATAGTDPSAPPTGAPVADPTAPAKPGPSTGPSAGPSTAPPAAGAITFKSPQDAVDHLLDAWRNDDKPSALQAAGPNTVTKVWTLPKQAEKQIESCDKTNGQLQWAYNCYWRYEGGSTHFYVNPYAATGFRVENFEQIAD